MKYQVRYRYIGTRFLEAEIDAVNEPELKELLAIECERDAKTYVSQSYPCYVEPIEWQEAP